VGRAPREHLRPEQPDRADADDDRAPARDEVDSAQDARERLDPNAVQITERGGQRHAVRRAQVLGEPAEVDARIAELTAGRLLPGAQRSQVPQGTW